MRWERKQFRQQRVRVGECAQRFPRFIPRVKLDERVVPEALLVVQVGIHHFADTLVAYRHETLDIAPVFFQYRGMVVQDINHSRVLSGLGGTRSAPMVKDKHFDGLSG